MDIKVISALKLLNIYDIKLSFDSFYLVYLWFFTGFFMVSYGLNVRRKTLARNYKKTSDKLI